MSAKKDKTPCRTLGEYVGELVGRLHAADPAAAARLRQVVGGRAARIAVDAEAVIVRFGAHGLELQDGCGAAVVDGSGMCDRRTVLDLLDGYLEISHAIGEDRIRVHGGVDAVKRMFIAIEILLDGCARIPALRALAEDYRADPCLPDVHELNPAGRSRKRRPSTTGDAERELLQRLDLLP